jgi:hypothetical protein
MNQRRLDFETTRDSLLAPGRIDQTAGSHAGVTVSPFRAPFIYGFVERQNLPGCSAFDFIARTPRVHSAFDDFPRQALFMMNSPTAGAGA